MNGFALDLRHSLGALGRSPAFSLSVILILALGLGANILIWSVVDNVLLRPLAFAEPDRLSSVWPERPWFTKRELDAFRATSVALEDTAGYYLWSKHTLVENGEGEVLEASQVSANFFSVLGVAPLHGRGFAPGEDRPGADKVVVLGYELWQRRFGGDPGLVGRALDLDDYPTTVVGVMPAGFSFGVTDRDLWVPLVSDPAAAADYDDRYVRAVARLRAGVSRDEAVADTRRVATVLWDELGIRSEKPEILTLPKLQDELVGNVRPLLVWLLIAVGSLLLIAAVNVANLLLTRGVGRAREFAVRSALGCGRFRMVRWLLGESVLLALAGGALGLALARFGLTGLVKALPSAVPRADEIVIDGRVALAGLVLSLLTGVAFGAAPAINLARGKLFGTLRAGSGTVSGRSRGRRVLVTAEVALAFVLVTAAGLAAKSFWQASRVDPGFEPAGIHTFEPMLPDVAHQAVSPVDEPAGKYEESAPRLAFFREVRSRLEAVPGVEAVGAIHMLPIRSRGYQGYLEIEGLDVPSDERPRVSWRVIKPGYFETMGIPRLTGRLLDGRDRAGSTPTVLVNASFAERYLADDDPLGARIKINIEDGAGWLTVVGVVGDVHQNGPTAEVRPEIYRPIEQVEPMVGLTFVVRSTLTTAEVSRRVHGVVAAVDPHVPVAFERTMTSILQGSLSFERFILSLAAIFAFLATILGAAGIYGVVAFDVSRRTPEIGLRMALGARRDGVLGMVLRQGMTPAVAGLVLGTGLSLALGRYLRSLLYEVEPGDFATYASMSLLLFAVAAAAVWVPAWRASRVDPLTALRHE